MDKERAQSIFISERMIISAIIINAISIFISTFFPHSSPLRLFFLSIDELCALYFLIEVSLKIRLHGFNEFWKRAWDRFDLILVILTLPSLIEPFLPYHYSKLSSALSLLRLLRLLKLLKFIPNSIMLISGLKRALKASIGVILCLAILNLIFALGATILFKDAPGGNEFFGSPLESMYTMFKVFTVEGWYEIPDKLSLQAESTWAIFMIRSYFILSVGTGGLLGLSLANAIFVDEMTLDNNLKIEEMIAELTTEVKELRSQLKNEN